MKIAEFEELANYLLDNNLELVKKGQHKISIGLQGAPGIGKTAIVKEIADKRGASLVRIELSSLEEIGDLCGMPIKEYNLTKESKEIWVAEKLLPEYINMGWKLCEECAPRMSYAIPAWVPSDPDQEVILLLDDYTRATSLFMQATMSLIQFGEYVSWKLPEKTHLLLTSNEDDGMSNISSLDSAQQTRLLNFHLDFDYKQYGKWMDQSQFRSETINFMLLNPEIFKQSERVNARTYTMFANAISGLKKFDDDTLETISLIARGCFGNDTTIGEMFAMFVHNNLDKLLTAEEMLGGKWVDTSKKLEECIYKDNSYRADISSVLTMRLVNYSEMLTDSKQIEKLIKRLEDIFSDNRTIFTEDLLYNLIKNVYKKHGPKMAKLMLNPKVRQKVLG